MNWTSRSLPGKEPRLLGEQVTALLSGWLVHLCKPACGPSCGPKKQPAESNEGHVLYERQFSSMACWLCVPEPAEAAGAAGPSAGSVWVRMRLPASAVFLSDAFRMQASTSLASCSFLLTQRPPMASQGLDAAERNNRQEATRPWACAPLTSGCWLRLTGQALRAQGQHPDRWCGCQGSRDSGLHSALGPPGWYARM